LGFWDHVSPHNPGRPQTQVLKCWDYRHVTTLRCFLEIFRLNHDLP
jgi:hypothetical protein